MPVVTLFAADGIRIYAVSDIHGRADLLRDVFAAIDHHLAHAGPARTLHVFLGDYIDRGPASRQTIDLLIERSRRHESIFLKGNHEAFLFEVLQDASRLEAWKQYGGFQTLMSYGLVPSIKSDRDEQNELVQALLHCMPNHHRRFFSNLRSSLLRRFLFCACWRQTRRAVATTARRRLALESGMSSFKVKKTSANSLCMAIPPCPNPKFDRTGLISIHEPMRPAF